MQELFDKINFIINKHWKCISFDIIKVQILLNIDENEKKIYYESYDSNEDILIQCHGFRSDHL